jgi:NAD(P)-dependent dehydrogenase (short-subunit alcohol dehydrogenase family)
MPLNGKNAIVTGAAGGMGTEICSLFAEQGANVAMVDIATERLEKLQAHLSGRQVGLRTYGHSVTDQDAVAATVADVVAAFGGIDILVNAAGTGHPQDGKVADIPVEIFDEIMDINIKGAFLFCRAVIPHLVTAGGGAIVNISSAGALEGIKTQGSTAYRISKTAMIGLTKAVAAHYAEQSVRCTAVCPGPTETPVLWEAVAKFGPQIRSVPATLPRTAQPSEIAGLVAFLVNDTGSFMSGGVVTIDGALTLH